MGLDPSAPADETGTYPVSRPPAQLRLDPFYAKHVNASGLPVVGSSKVSSYALKEAAYLVDHMLAHRSGIRDALIRNRVRVAVMAYSERTTEIPEHRDLEPRLYWNWRARGVGATRARPASSCAEENLLGFPGDPYRAENITIHEFVYRIYILGINPIDPRFSARLRGVYQEAIAGGLWKGTYAASNPEEYWAEEVQSWFDANSAEDAGRNRIGTREQLKAYDPGLARLIESVFGDRPWRYVPPARRNRADKGHLAGYDPSRAPTFRWEPELVEARRRYRESQKRAGANGRPARQGAGR